MNNNQPDNKTNHNVKQYFVYALFLVLGIIICMITQFTYAAAHKKNQVEDRNEAYLESIPVVAYHLVCTDEEKNGDYKENNYYISQSLFESHMKYLYENKYTAVTLDQFYEWKTTGKKLADKPILITFDDSYDNTVDYAAPIMKKYNMIGATFNILSRPFSEDKFKQNKNVVEMASHTYNLHRMVDGAPVVLGTSNGHLDKDFTNAAQKHKTQYIAYPFGVYSRAMHLSMKKNKYKLGFLFSDKIAKATRLDGNYLIPRIPIMGEVSLNKFIDILSVQ